MRKIPDVARNSLVETIRVKIFEEILKQKQTLSTFNYEANAYLKRLSKLPSTRNYIESEAASISTNAWQALYSNYILQDQAIRKSNIAIPYDANDEIFHGIAKAIFDECLFNTNFWAKIDGEELSKSIFRKNFFAKMSSWVCPYCDIAKDPTGLSFEIDHLLPSSKFPLLFVHEYNLIPACASCNSMHTGKANNFIAEYKSYYFHEIGYLVRFKYAGNGYVISTSDSIANEHLKLLKLPGRLEEPGVILDLKLIEKKFAKFIKAGISLSELLDPIESYQYASIDIYNQLINSQKSSFQSTFSPVATP